MNKILEVVFCTSDLTLMAFAGFVHYPLLAKEPLVWKKNLCYMLCYFAWITVAEAICAVIQSTQPLTQSTQPLTQSEPQTIAFILFWVGIFITFLIIYRHYLLASTWDSEVYTTLCQLNMMCIFAWGCRLVLLLCS